MKKVVSILAVAVLTLGFVSCESESVADQEQLFTDANDTDDGSVDRSANDTDDGTVERS